MPLYNPPIGALGFRNRIINPSGQVAVAGVASTADGAYTGFDQWLALTQSNAVTPSALTNVENGTPCMMRLTQANATPQRYGWLQWLESANCIDLRGVAVVLSARARMSASTTLRYAIVEWTGTADTITKDLVNDWTSSTFTTGNFFTSTTTTVVAAGSLALTANTLASIILAGTISGSLTNLAAFFWTDSTQAQNVTLDIGKVQLETGAFPTPLAFRSINEETGLCQRYYQQLGGANNAIILQSFANAATNSFAWPLPFTTMRIVPTASIQGTWFTLNCTGPTIPAATNSVLSLQIVASATGGVQASTSGSTTFVKLDGRL